MSLAQRVRDFRYSKGWGPDELASRAEISRTALYQIESGKTGLPRAGTLRRIALALDVSMDELLGHAEAVTYQTGRHGDHPASVSRGRGLGEWIPAEGGPLTLPGNHSHTGSHGHLAALEEGKGEETRLAVEGQQRRSPSMGFESLLMREGELMSKLHDLLHSHLGAGIAQIVEELHTMIPRNRNVPQ